MGRIAVGVDGSRHGSAALRWAAAEARAHGHALQAITISPPDWLPDPSRTAGLQAAKRVQVAALARLEAELGPDHGLEITETRDVGIAADRILHRAKGADLLVVGSRGFGRLRGALLGSVSRQVVTHADLPVAVVRGDDHRVDRIVVGVDGSIQADTALQWAHGEARVHGAVLEAVLVQLAIGDVVGTPWLPPGVSPDHFAARTSARERLHEAIDRAAHGDPGVVRTVREGAIAHELIEAAEDADLLVVGRRGLGGFDRLLLGSVSARCLTHAPCPVVIVPDA